MRVLKLNKLPLISYRDTYVKLCILFASLTAINSTFGYLI